jgi:hypothetical protein
VAGMVGLYFGSPFWFYVAGSVLCLLPLSSYRGTEVNILFYTFFMLTFISVLLALHLHNEGFVDLRKFDFNNLDSLEDGGLFIGVLRWLIQVMTDAKGELKFVSVLLGLAFIPRILSYLIAGIFGCGRPPVFVETLTSFALLSFVKFYCGFAGLNLGVAICLGVVETGSSHNFETVWEHAQRSAEPLFFAFAVAAVDAGFWPLLGMFRIKARTRRVLRILAFMVRKVEVELALQPYEKELIGYDRSGLQDVIEIADLGQAGRYKDVLERSREKPSENDTREALDIDHLAGLVVERANARLRRDENRHLDRVARRIAWLVDHSLIEKRRDKASGNVLYADAGDRRLWEFTVRRLHGSGFNSPRLSVVSEEEAAKKYCSSSTQDDLPDVVSAGPVAVDADDEKRQDNQEQRVQGPSPGEATRWPA